MHALDSLGFTPEDLRQDVDRATISFLANFEVSVGHLGDGMEGFEAVLGFLPKRIWAIIDGNAYFFTEKFLQEHRLTPGLQLYESAALSRHTLFECLASLLKLAWERGYLMYRFWRSGERLLEPDQSLDVSRLNNLVIARVEASGWRLSSTLEVFAQRVVSTATEVPATMRNLEALGSPVLTSVITPLAEDWAMECARLMTLGMITASEELDMQPKAGIIVTGHGNIVITERVENSLNNINISVAQLATAGHQDISSALDGMREAILADAQVDGAARTELLETLEEIATQANAPADQRMSRGALKTLVAGFAASTATAGGLAEVWSTWGPQISQFLGL